MKLNIIFRQYIFTTWISFSFNIRSPACTFFNKPIYLLASQHAVRKFFWPHRKLLWMKSGENCDNLYTYHNAAQHLTCLPYKTVWHITYDPSFSCLLLWRYNSLDQLWPSYILLHELTNYSRSLNLNWL